MSLSVNSSIFQLLLVIFRHKSKRHLGHSAAELKIFQPLSRAMARSASNSVNPSNGLVKMKRGNRESSITYS